MATNKISANSLIASEGSSTWVDVGKKNGVYSLIPSGEAPIGYHRHLKKFGLVTEPASTNMIFPSSGMRISAPDVVEVTEVNSMFEGEVSPKFINNDTNASRPISSNLYMDKEEPFTSTWYLETVSDDDSHVRFGLYTAGGALTSVWLYNATMQVQTGEIDLTLQRSGTEVEVRNFLITETGPNGGKLWKIELICSKVSDDVIASTNTGIRHMLYCSSIPSHVPNTNKGIIYHHRQIEKHLSATSPIITDQEKVTRAQRLLGLDRSYLEAKDFTLKAEFSRNGYIKGGDTVNAVVCAQNSRSSYSYRAALGPQSHSTNMVYITELRLRGIIVSPNDGVRTNLDYNVNQGSDLEDSKLCRIALSQKGLDRSVAVGTVAFGTRQVANTGPVLNEFGFLAIGWAFTNSRALNGYIFSIQFSKEGSTLEQLQEWVAEVRDE